MGGRIGVSNGKTERPTKEQCPQSQVRIKKLEFRLESFNHCNVCLEVISWYEIYRNIFFLDLRRRERVWNSSCVKYNRGKKLDTKRLLNGNEGPPELAWHETVGEPVVMIHDLLQQPWLSLNTY